MRAKLRFHHPSPAMGVALRALFVALIRNAAGDSLDLRVYVTCVRR